MSGGNVDGGNVGHRCIRCIDAATAVPDGSMRSSLQSAMAAIFCFMAAGAAPGIDAASAAALDATVAAPEPQIALLPGAASVASAIEPKADFVVPAVIQDEGQPESLSELVADHRMPMAIDAETECLAGAVYFEARSEPLDGQLAVADVILNRAASGRFPTSMCGVVYQPHQFSFVRGGTMPAIRRDSVQWRQAVAIAEIARDDLWNSSIGQALFFHASHVSPRWNLKRLGRVGNHIFYR